jgi:hypothetical protein
MTPFSLLSATLLLGLLVACSSEPNTGYNSSARDAAYISGMANTKPPPMDPNRKVDDEDCSRPIQPERGNLRCK